MTTPINNFLPFGIGPNDDATSQSDYSVATWRTQGWRSGILPHQQINKVLRQTSSITAAVAQIAAEALQAQVLDDGDQFKLTNQLRQLFSAGMPYSPALPYAVGSIGYALKNIAANAGAAYVAPGAGASNSSVAAVLAHRLTMAEYVGFDGTGGTSSNAAWASAFSALATVYGAPESLTALGDVVLSHNEAFDGCGARIVAQAGAFDIFNLGGAASRISDVYIADATALNVGGASFAFKGGYYDMLRHATIVNAGPKGIRMAPVAGQSCKAARIHDVIVEGFTGFGLEMRSSVNDGQFSTLYLNGKLDTLAGGLKPHPGSVGWYQNTPIVSGLAVGGHLVRGLTTIACDEGVHIVDAEYTKFNNVIADSCSSYGLIVGGSSHDVKFADLFVGTTKGICLTDSAQVEIDGLETRNNGVIPGWGDPSFYGGAGTFYDVTLFDTAKLKINGENWRGDKRVLIAPTASLVVTGGDWITGKTRTQVAPAAIYYLNEHGEETGASANRAAAFRVKRNSYLFLAQAQCTDAPGAGFAFTYNVYIGGALVHSVVIANASFANKSYANGIYCAEGQEGYIELVSPVGAVASWHGVQLQFLPE